MALKMHSRAQLVNPGISFCWRGAPVQLHGINYFGEAPRRTPASAKELACTLRRPPASSHLSCTHAGFNVSATAGLCRITSCFRVPCRLSYQCVACASLCCPKYLRQRPLLHANVLTADVTSCRTGRPSSTACTPARTRCLMVRTSSCCSPMAVVMSVSEASWYLEVLSKSEKLRCYID